MLEKFLPDPRGFETTEAYNAATQNAHYIWFVFVGIGLVSAIALLAYGYITRKIDAKKAIEEA